MLITHHNSQTFAVWDVSAKLAQFFFLLLNFIDRIFILIADFSNLSVQFFLFIKLKIFTFSLKGNTLWLIFGRSELPLYFGAVNK